MSTTELREGNPSRSGSFLESEGIQSVFHEALMSVQPFPNSIKALEKALLDGVTNESAFFFIFFSFLLVDSLTGSKYLLLFYKIVHSTGHVQVEKGVAISAYGSCCINIYLQEMSVCTLNHASNYSTNSDLFLRVFSSCNGKHVEIFLY